MKGKKLSMREIRKILEYRFDKHISAHRTALALKKSKGSIINTVKRAGGLYVISVNINKIVCHCSPEQCFFVL